MFWSDFVPCSFEDLAATIDGDPLRWLPQPVERTGPRTYRGTVRVLGRDVHVTYEVNVGDVDAHGYRCLQVTPRGRGLSPLQTEISVLPAESQPGWVRLSVIGAPTPGPGSRLVAPVARRVLFTALRERITARLLNPEARRNDDVPRQATPRPGRRDGGREGT